MREEAPGPASSSAPGAVQESTVIASDALHLSVDAVKTHLRALFEKFELGEVPQNQKRITLVQRAMQSGLIGPRDL